MLINWRDTFYTGLNCRTTISMSHKTVNIRTSEEIKSKLLTEWEKMIFNDLFCSIAFGHVRLKSGGLREPLLATVAFVRSFARVRTKVAIQTRSLVETLITDLTEMSSLKRQNLRWIYTFSLWMHLPNFTVFLKSWPCLLLTREGLQKCNPLQKIHAQNGCVYGLGVKLSLRSSILKNCLVTI